MNVVVAVAAADGERAESLRRCLEAVMRGSTPPQRVLVVDQSGGTALRTAVDSLDLAVPIEIVEQPRLGLAASRNLALDRLHDGVVAVTDDDCVPDTGWLEAIVRAFAADPSLAAVTGPVLPLPPTAGRTEPVSTRSRSEPGVFAGRVPPWHVGTGGNMALNSARLDGLRFDERLGTGTPGRAGEDLALIDRLLATGARIRYEPAAVVRHERQSPERRRASRYGYGYGVGAMIGLGLRRHDGVAALHLARWLALRARLAVTRQAPAEELRVLAGTASGLVYGLRRP
jgi:glycosyltransferase involved in cell wall biosynthesis